METEEQGAGGSSHIRARHIKKRALKNKSLSISFDEKDLKDFVTGFHKRKKKRRKEANIQIQEADRRKRIELRKKRKLDKEFVLYGGAPPPDLDANEGETVEEEDHEDSEPVASLSAVTMYESGDVQVTVTTSEISREEENPPTMSMPVKRLAVEGVDQKKQKVTAIKKKPVKKASKKKPQKRTQSKRDKRKGKIQSKKR